MDKVRKLFIITPIHLIMGGISLIFLLVSLKGLSHSGVVMLSLSVFAINIIGYLLLSLFMLKSYKLIEVINSTFFFLGIGLFIWIVFLKTGHLGNLFFLYHTAGYSSFMWYVYSLAETNERLLMELGSLYSIIPSALILIGFYLSNCIKTKRVLQRVSLYMGGALFSIIAVFLSAYNGKRIETREELASAFPIETGFPLNFAELSYPTIDPPLPWTYSGFDCCSLLVISWSNFWLSVIMVFLLLFLLIEALFLIRKKVEEKRFLTNK